MARISPKFKLLQTPLARVMLPHVKIADISARSGMEVSTLIAAIKDRGNHRREALVWMTAS